MGNRTAFIGHRLLLSSEKVKERLQEAIRKEIEGGCHFFTMGTHGDFDKMALSLCKQERQDCPDILIEVVLTSYHTIAKRDKRQTIPYEEVTTVLFDSEETHFKRRIIESNRKMIDGCDTLLCYVDEKKSKSGAKRALLYAKRKGLRITNLFREEDNPTHGMTPAERCRYWKETFDDPEKGVPSR